MLEAWKKILVQYENEGNSVDALMSGPSTLGGDATKQNLIDADRGDSVELEQLKVKEEKEELF